MNIPQDELATILSKFNPWWRGEPIPDLPRWQRATFLELLTWVDQPPAPRAVLLSGARQVGKTTLLLQAIEALLNQGTPANNILYVTLDHPILKLAGIDAILQAWRMREPISPGYEYLFIDEAQFARDWGTWVKHQVDFNKQRRIIFTGSATPLLNDHTESGVGRWHTINLSTLSFYEYLQIQRVNLPPLPELSSFNELFTWSDKQFHDLTLSADHYTVHFHEYLMRGGFPQTALVESVTQAQRLLREDIIDKVLKRDMTALFGVRRVLELEQTFIYLCMHDGGILDMTDLCDNLAVKRPTAAHFIELLQASHLIYRLPPYGYGKDILRGKFKIYLADPAIASAVLLKGKALLDDPQGLGVATETAVFKHLHDYYSPQHIRFSYWKGSRDHEVDLLAEQAGTLIPFEIKYRAQHTGLRDLKGLIELCEKKSLTHAFVITKSWSDFGKIKTSTARQIMQVPAPLLCYWAGIAGKRLFSD